MTKGPTSLGETDLASYRRKDWVIVLPAGTGVDDALKPEFWAHVGKKLAPLQRIELQAADRSFIADCVVLSAGPGFAKVKLLTKHVLVEDLAALEAEEAGEGAFVIKWESPSTLWAVIRKSDKVKIKSGFATKEDAQNFAINHQRVIA